MLIEIVIFFVGVNCGVGGGDVGYVCFSLSLSSIFCCPKRRRRGRKATSGQTNQKKKFARELSS